VFLCLVLFLKLHCWCISECLDVHILPKFLTDPRMLSFMNIIGSLPPRDLKHPSCLGGRVLEVPGLTKKSLHSYLKQTKMSLLPFFLNKNGFMLCRLEMNNKWDNGQKVITKSKFPCFL
jgi:hypothetical protein